MTTGPPPGPPTGPPPGPPTGPPPGPPTGASPGALGAARDAAGRLLDVVEGPERSEDGLEGIVHLATDALDADAATLTFATPRGGWAEVSTLEPVPLPVTWCGDVAERAMAATDGRARSVETAEAGDGVGAEDAAAPSDAAVTTRIAQAVRTADGDPIGALEVVWTGAVDPEARTWRTLRRLADHAAQVLELRAEVTEYRRFVSLIPEPVTVLDLDGTIEVVNPAFVRLLGHADPDALIGRRLVDLLVAPDRSRVTTQLAEVLFARRSSAHLEVALLDASGNPVPCAVTAGHLRGARRQLQLVVHDLSERQRGEEARSRLSEQLARAQRLDAVGRIAGGLAHDLNNLLGVLVANVSLARESLTDLAVEASIDGEALRTIGDDLDGMDLAIDRAVGLTRGLLEFGRREDGIGRRADVGAAVDAVRELVSRSLGPGVQLDVDLAPELPPVATDVARLERVLVNLVINAADAVDGAGSIRIAARAVDARPGPDERRDAGRRPAGTTGRQVRIDVVDDGGGMDAATLARAFEPLFTTKGDAGGSGLGLATVVAFTDAVGGSVALDSTPGEGTRVRLELPVVEGPTEVGSPDEPAGARVLLVDPSEPTRRIIAEMLRAVGHQVHDVGSGEAALGVLDRVRPDLLITELALGGTTGDRLVATARQGRPRLRAIVLAALDGPRTLGDSPVLVKPFSHDRLLRTVERVLGER